MTSTEPISGAVFSTKILAEEEWVPSLESITLAVQVNVSPVLVDSESITSSASVPSSIPSWLVHEKLRPSVISPSLISKADAEHMTVIPVAISVLGVISTSDTTGAVFSTVTDTPKEPSPACASVAITVQVTSSPGEKTSGLRDNNASVPKSVPSLLVHS